MEKFFHRQSLDDNQPIESYTKEYIYAINDKEGLKKFSYQKWKILWHSVYQKEQSGIVVWKMDEMKAKAVVQIHYFRLSYGM